MATLKYKNPATSAWETLDALPAIGQTVEITATELTGKSTADRAAMYAAGTRLLKVVNGDTEVLLGLDADGSTEWLGSNKPIRNLLDNRNFEIAQAGYGGNHGTQAYACDRWKLVSGTVSHSDAGLTLNGTIAQVLENAPSVPVTAAASAGTITYDASAKTVTIATTEATVISWAALYEGSYTADTLPPYTPKGYAEELAECQRYYQAGLYLRSSAINQWNTYAESINFRVPMRAVPTCTFKGLSSGASGVCEMYKNEAWSNVACGTNDRDNKYISVVCANGGLEVGKPVRFLVDASADL